MSDQSSRDQSSRDQSSRDQSLRDQSLRDQSLRDQSLRDQSLRDQSSRDQSLRDQSLRDQSSTAPLPVPGQILPDQIVPDQNSVYLIGINGGGTRTTFALVDSALNVVTTAETGASNYHYVGEEAARRNLADGINTVTATIPLSAVKAVGAGIAGVDRPDDHALMTAMIQECVPGIPVLLENDALSALAAGVGKLYGIVAICGTGMIAYGVNADGTRARAGGWGYGIDLGSGYAMAREALYVISRAHDEGRACPLSDRLLTRLTLSDPTAIIPWLYAPDRRIDEVAALTAEVVALAESGDADSTRIVTHAARELAECVIATARKLDFPATPDAEAIPVLLSGSLFTHSPLLRAVFTEYLQTQFPNTTPFETDRLPAVGGAALALPLLNLPAPNFELPESPESSAIAAINPTRRATERRNPLTMHTPRYGLQLLEMMNLEDERVPRILRPQLPALAALAAVFARNFHRGGRLLLLGAGTSGRLAVVDAVECRPTFSTTPDQVIGIMAGGESAFVQAVENAEDDAELGANHLLTFNPTALDVVVGVAASGSTPWVIGALQAAKVRGATTGCIVNVAGGAIAGMVDYPIVAVTGAEALTGSTRLKAGSAQKMALNMLTTAALSWAGRTYGNLMVDVQRSNSKLNRRAVVIIQDATGLSADQAEAILMQCDGEIKTAILVALTGCDVATARAQLLHSHGDLETAQAER